MGVSGCGKSEISSRLATRLGVAHVEGDDYHTAANVAKMSAGQPLDDEDRSAWLLALQSKIVASRQSGESLVLSCSALKRRYRDLLRAGNPDLVFIFLAGERELIASRMQARPNHYFPLSLLDSQFRDLEIPDDDERVIRLDIRDAPDQLLAEILAAPVMSSLGRTHRC
jgi:gluconokinase